jgi:hypothetical protein
MRQRMAWLIQPKLAAARQLDGGERPPALVVW